AYWLLAVPGAIWLPVITMLRQNELVAPVVPLIPIPEKPSIEQFDTSRSFVETLFATAKSIPFTNHGAVNPTILQLTILTPPPDSIRIAETPGYDAAVAK